MAIEDNKCPLCEGPMVRRQSAHGPFWGCKSYPKCKGTLNASGEARRPHSEESDWYYNGRDLPSDRQRGNDRRRWDS